MGEDEEKAKQDLIRKLILQEADLEIERNRDWGNLQAEKLRLIDRYGPDYAKIVDADFRDREKALIADFEKRREEFAEHELKLWEDFWASRSPAEPAIKVEADTPKVEYTPSYKETVLKLKQERDEFMQAHFVKMADLTLNSDLTKEQVVDMLKPDHEQLANMAKSHYRELLGHHDNPFFKATFETAQKQMENQTAESVAEKVPEPPQPKIENPVEVTGDLYERMIKKFRERDPGHSW